MTEKTGYKYSAKVSQSLTSGTLAFEVYLGSDNLADYLDPKVNTQMRQIFKTIQQTFLDDTDWDFKVASSIPNNMQQLAKRKTELQLAKEVNKLEEGENGKK